MPGTTLADLQVVPAKMAQYVIEETNKKSALVRSGVAVADPRVAQIINGTPKGGNLINLPFYRGLDAEDEVFGEEEMSVAGVATAAEVATLLIRQKAWSDTDLGHVMGGTDPLGAIAAMLGDWWTQREKQIMLSILAGILNPTSGALKSHVLDISAETGEDALISVNSALDAKQLMGDAADKLGVVFMHSAVKTKLQKDKQIEHNFNSDEPIQRDYYLGYEVQVDDDMPVEDGVYTTYFLGKGAFARVDGMPEGLVGIEKDRKSLSSSNILINRRAFVIHPRGLAFKASAAAAFRATQPYASNDDLKKAANWTLAGDAKNCPIVALKHRITVAG